MVKESDNFSKERVRIDIIGVLKRVVPPSSNMTPSESKALRDLRDDNTIIILPADKARQQLYWRKEKYEGKLNNMLLMIQHTQECQRIQLQI